MRVSCTTSPQRYAPPDTTRHDVQIPHIRCTRKVGERRLSHAHPMDKSHAPNCTLRQSNRREPSPRLLVHVRPTLLSWEGRHGHTCGASYPSIAPPRSSCGRPAHWCGPLARPRRTQRAALIPGGGFFLRRACAWPVGDPRANAGVKPPRNWHGFTPPTRRASLRCRPVHPCSARVSARHRARLPGRHPSRPQYREGGLLLTASLRRPPALVLHFEKSCTQDVESSAGCVHDGRRHPRAYDPPPLFDVALLPRVWLPPFRRPCGAASSLAGGLGARCRAHAYRRCVVRARPHAPCLPALPHCSRAAGLTLAPLGEAACGRAPSRARACEPDTGGELARAA